jgi:predicted nucleic acid-binding protein
MILADSAVWIDHLRAADEPFAAALESETIVGHPFVTGEVALAGLQNRSAVIWRLRRLEQLPLARPEAVLTLIESQALSGAGIGYVDAHLLASVRLVPGTWLWTRDKRLRAQAERFGFAYTP